MRPAVFLDRDDTLIANRAVTAHSPHPGDLYDPALVALLPGAADACRRLKLAGFALVVVSNQGAVARGHCTTQQVDATNQRLRECVREQAGVELDGVYYCPYHPAGTIEPYNAEHLWRKPNPGMILWASDDLRLDLARSWMVGDAERDIVAAIRAGIDLDRCVLLSDAASAQKPAQHSPIAGVSIAPTLAHAADLILAREPERGLRP